MLAGGEEGLTDDTQAEEMAPLSRRSWVQATGGLRGCQLK